MTTYEFQEYPKALYREAGEYLVARDAAEEREAIAEGWRTTEAPEKPRRGRKPKDSE